MKNTLIKNKNKKKMNNEVYASNNITHELGYVGWRYYNKIKKKAVEQEFSMSGLVISLSIAFFIVIVSALILSSLVTIIETSMAENAESNKNYVHKNSKCYSLSANINIYKLNSETSTIFNNKISKTNNTI